MPRAQDTFPPESGGKTLNDAWPLVKLIEKASALLARIDRADFLFNIDQ
jgi:hypothetical protein